MSTDRIPSSDRRTRAWIEVQGSAVRRNYHTIRSAAGGIGVIPMVKADGYGLGAEGVVTALEAEDPLAWGVAAVEEGTRLRTLGVRRPILVFAPLPPGSYGEAVAADLTVCLSSLDGLRRLDEAAARHPGGTASFHVEVDTGIGRAGFDWRRAAEWGPVIVARQRAGMRWAGCYTHLHSADEDPSTIAEQWRRLVEVLGGLSHPREDFMVHVQNSAGALHGGRLASGGYRVDAVRPGVFLYGGSAGPGLPEPVPVAAVRARVVLVREAAPGSTLGYGATHTARGPERWATLGIGYGDGLPRALGNRGEALIRGRRVPIIGRVSMDMTVVNISDVDGVEPGDVATLIGESGAERITVDEVAGLAGTISYEVLTGFTPRLPRIWMDDGRA